jgi:hypothetical protein
VDAPDALLELTACKLSEAEAAIREAHRLLNYREGAEKLGLIANYLGGMAEKFHAGSRDEGLKQVLVDRKLAAQVMGQSISHKKLEQLAKARDALAEKRSLVAGERMIRRRVCGF